MRGLAWNAGYQIFAALVQFGAMLVVVRIIPPEEYGHWVVALGILQLLNAVNVATFMAHALQLPTGEEPDWTLHWQVGNLVQFGLFVACTATAVWVRRAGMYEGVSVLLHIASVGLLFNTPAQLRMVMLQRRLDFRRMRTMTAVSSLLAAAVIVLGAMAGLGARALVLGGNVVVSIPLTIDLLVVERWRPMGKWLAWPDLRRYRASIVFGTTRIGTGVLASTRGALTAFLLPSTLGFAAIGLMNRAESLFAMSVGRAITLISETVYPVLPQLASDEARFARAVRAYSLLLLTLSLAGLGLFAACGPELSRVLYGLKWVAADPFLVPGAAIGLAAAVGTLASQVLLARGQLKQVLALGLLPQLCVVPAFIGAAAFDWDPGLFFWSTAAGLLLSAVLGLYFVRRRLALAWSGVWVAPAVAAAGGWAAAALVGTLTEHQSPGMRAAIGAFTFSLTWLLTLRFLFRSTLDEMLALAPGGSWLRQLLRTTAILMSALMACTERGV
jgi:O-antigen/teichoic acid export membrane protein